MSSREPEDHPPSLPATEPNLSAGPATLSGDNNPVGPADVGAPCPPSGSATDLFPVEPRAREHS
jgi:hypothetical protein